MIGIYKITNKVNNNSYIGQSVNIEKRWERHKISYKNEFDHNYNNHLYRAMRKYGLENFTFEIIEICNQEELNNKERYYIEKYDTFFNGYNLTLGGDSAVGKIDSKESIIGVIYDLENTIMSHQDIAEKWNMSREMVQGINTGRYWKHNRKYPIQDPRAQFLRRGITKTREKAKCLDCGKDISYGALRCVSCENMRRQMEHKMPVDREELKQLIRTLPFTTIGNKYNVSDNAIRRWCEKYNLPKKAREIKQYTDEEWTNI